jgi:hypothetical protein
MTQKKSFEDWQKLAFQRNHVLSNPTNSETPSKGSFTVKCNSCGTTFIALAKNYGSARKTGCATCKAIKAKAQSGPQRKKSQDEIKSEESKILQKQISDNQNVQILSNFPENQISRFDSIVDKVSMKNYLQEENNVYTNYILEKLETRLIPEDVKTLHGEPVQSHHIIPYHMGGINSSFNRIRLTVSEHETAHKFHYLAYKQFGDYNYLHMKNLTGTEEIPINPEYENRIRENAIRGGETQRQQQIGIFAPNAAQKAGLISGQREKSRAHKLSSQNQRCDTTRSLLNITGSKWTHQQTGTVVILPPSPTMLMRDVKQALATALPMGHHNRVQLEKNTGKNKTTQINHLAKLIKNKKNRGTKVYGFSFEPLSMEND